MLQESLGNRIQLLEEIDTWENAIESVAKPLIESNHITLSYKDAMISNINRLGSYMILAPGIAMPHSRPEDGVNENGLSLLILKNEVLFPEDQKAWLILCLAAKSSDSHIDMIEAIAELLSDDELLLKIKNATNVEEIQKLLKNI